MTHLDVQHAFSVLMLDLPHGGLVPLLHLIPAGGNLALRVHLEVLITFDFVFRA